MLCNRCKPKDNCNVGTTSLTRCYKYENTSSNPIFLIPTCYKRTHNAKITLRQLTFTQDKKHTLN